MMRLDTTLMIVDAKKRIVGGFIIPFYMRALDGRFYDTESRLHISRDPLPIFSDHDRSRAGICGLAKVEVLTSGVYAEVQLYDHPHSPWYQEQISKGVIAFSHDGKEKAESDGYVPEVVLIGASLTAWPYMRPNYIPTAEQYISLINRYCQITDATPKFTDPALERMPIPERYQYDSSQ